jgi:hemerythrin-like metal-binding protein
MNAGHGKEVLEKVLAELVDYTKFHFAREEQFFVKTGYGDAATHKNEHDALIKKVLELQARHKKGASTLSMEVMNFLKDWLTQHIQGIDQKYGPHLNAKGIH